ncbi:MAG TPA: PQQ-binding-like beta-propeller repeat protein [Solirubrobacteraceae bacterium]|nr:PQQ-binding-like beta-propeller repeat protein [Solirubrobacteraceae bacterium]
MARLAATASTALVCACAALAGTAQAEPAWTTYHRDPGRSGDDPEATSPIVPALAWQSVGLGAPIWQQPLILGTRAYVATVGNDVYALDTSSGAVIWSKHAGTPVPAGSLPCGDIAPTVGIVGTPVIDVSTNAIYAVADIWDGAAGEAHHVLVGYDLATGAEVLRTPVDPPGEDPKAHLQRTALTLDAGRVVFGLGGNDGDCGTYRGTVVAVPELGGAPAFWQVPIAVKSKSGGAVWGASGPVVDGAGRIYATTGNPNPRGESASTYDYSDSVVALDPNLNLIGHFEPPSWQEDSNNDTDLGSAGAELLPGGLLFQAGKNGTGYLIDTATMQGGAAAVYSAPVCGGHASFGGDAYAAGVIYVACSNGAQALAYNQAARSFAALWKGPSDAAGPPIVSAGLVWVIATHGASPGSRLYRLDPGTGVPRYTEPLPSSAVDHFASPSAAGGRLFLASGSSVTAFQIAALPPGSAATGLPPPPAHAPGSAPHDPLAATLASASLTVGASGKVVVKVRCPSAVRVCRGVLILRTLKAVLARAAEGWGAFGASARRVVLLLATGTFAVPGGHVKAVTLRLGPRARRLLSRVRVVRARATLLIRDATGALHTSRTTVTLRLAKHRRRR